MKLIYISSKVCLGHNNPISGVCSPIPMKFGMVMGLWILITRKLLWLPWQWLPWWSNSFLWALKQLILILDLSTWKIMEIENGILKCGSPWKQHVAIATKKISIIWLVFTILITFWCLLLEGNICYSVSNPLTRAPREGQGPSMTYHKSPDGAPFLYSAKLTIWHTMIHTQTGPILYPQPLTYVSGICHSVNL